MNRAILYSMAGCLIGVAVVGCSKSTEKRNTVAWHTKAVRIGIENVRKQLPHPEDNYGMWTQIDKLQSALYGLPRRIEKKKPPGWQERKKTAEKAYKLWQTMYPVLHSLKYDEAEMNKKLDELIKLMDEVDKR